jgi:hypothetical protein
MSGSSVAQVAAVVQPTSKCPSGAVDSAAAAFVLTELLVDALLDPLELTAIHRMRRQEAAGAAEVLA